MQQGTALGLSDKGGQRRTQDTAANDRETLTEEERTRSPSASQVVVARLDRAIQAVEPESSQPQGGS